MSLEAKFSSANHIVFAPSGAGTLRQRISELNAIPKVLCLRDDLSMGLLDTVQSRVDWFTEVFGKYDWREDIEQRSTFWKQVPLLTGPCCVWFSRRSAQDYCGYLEWVSHQCGKVHEVIDADTPIGVINFLPEWLEHFAQAKIADFDQQSMGAQDWSRLVSENAPVRVIRNNKIVSAPLDCFDDLLLARATPEWKSAALLVGEVLANDFEEIRQTGDLLLVNRLWALVDAGRLEARGDESSIRSVRMRIKPV